MATTDPQGKVLISVIPGDYDVTAQKVGYRSQTQEVLGVVDGETRPVQFRLEREAAALDVSVVDAAGMPVDGATVTIRIRT